MIASLIDHTALKNTTTIADVEKLCSEAIEYRFASVCIPPYYVSDAMQILNNQVKICTVIGFPFGYHHYKTKTEESNQAILDGAAELDMVMNLAAFKNNDIAYLENEVNEIISITKGKQTVIKVIIESGILSDEEILKCCRLYAHFPIQFLKTSSGFTDKGATIEAVKLMRQFLPSHIGIKASGGIRSYSFAKELIEAGATRIGCSASVTIIKEEATELARF
jgi:deoxyribose-phosphate aldolase